MINRKQAFPQLWESMDTLNRVREMGLVVPGLARRSLMPAGRSASASEPAGPGARPGESAHASTLTAAGADALTSAGARARSPLRASPPPASPRLAAIPAVLVLLLAVLTPVVFSPSPARAASYDLRGQASAWLTHIHNQGEWEIGAGARYIPQLTLARQLSDETLIDLEISLNALAEHMSSSEEDTAYVDLYRLKLRFATASSETRVGLQQLNFGPAYLLRPLRWFDVLDPRDPQGLTDGVYAASLKYVTLGNSSIWLWGLFGNEDPKGYETLPTLEGRVEYGGRAQIPLLTGEAAVAYHHRVVDGPAPFVADFHEDRFGLDGRWDVGVGAWFETAFTRQPGNGMPPWVSMTTLGTDYTFALGNGLHTLLEHMLVNISDEPLESGDQSNITGLSLSYPAGYVDRLSAISFYSWDSGDFSQYVGWDRYWEHIALNVSVFYYPERDPSTSGGVYNPVVMGGGYGAQVMLILNH